MKKVLVFVLIGLGLVHLESCKRDGGPSWDTGIVLPLAHASLSIDNLITDSLISSNADGSVKIVYSTNFLGLNTDTIFNIPDTTISNSYHIPAGFVDAAPGFQFANTTTQTTFAITNAQLVNGILNEGLMTLYIQNDIRKRMLVTYQIPCATLNSIPFDTTFMVDAAIDSLHPTFRTAVIDLAGYALDFTGVLHNRVNTITTTFSAQIDPNEIGNTRIYPSDTVAANNTFSGVKPYYLRGYFGNQTIQIGPEETGFSLFQKITSGSIGLDSLTMSLDVKNYVGMDSRLTINSIWSRNSRTGQSVYLSNSLLGSPINIDRGVYSNTWPPVIPSVYNLTFDNSNSNAKALVENLPDQLGYDVTLITNPLGNVSGNNDFLFSAYGIDATLNVEMPLNLFADQLVVGDTIIPNFSSIENKEDILKGTITVFASNSFPFDAALEMYFIDVLGNVIGSVVVQPNVFLAGPTAATGGYLMSIGFTNSQVSIPLSEGQTTALFNSAKIVFVSKFDTNSNPTYAKIFGSNRLDLKISADFDYHVGN